MPVCKVCKGEKPNREMALWGGSVTETCLDCKAAKKAAKNGGAPAAAVKAVEPPVPAAAPAIVVLHGGPLEVAIDPSLGFTAKVDDGRLVITQANGARVDDDDNITLTREEAKALFNTFGEWIVGAAA